MAESKQEVSDDTESDYLSETSNDLDDDSESQEIKKEYVHECDYVLNETFKLQEDAYFVTFAAYMTDDFSPLLINYSTGMTFKVFLV